MVFMLLTAALAQITVEVPAFEQEWGSYPARFVVSNDVRTARVVDLETNKEVPSKVQQLREKRYVFWQRSDDGQRSHRYSVELDGKPSDFEPAFVGADDMLVYGPKDTVADLGVGLWATAMPIDWDQDGDWDLVYVCDGVPQSGVYLYLQEDDGIFRRVRRFGDGEKFASIGDVDGDGKWDLIAGTTWFNDIDGHGMTRRKGRLYRKPVGDELKLRTLQSRLVDWDGDGLMDLMSAYGDWFEYGWDDAYDETGNWVAGPLHGRVRFHRNTGTSREPYYQAPIELEADDQPIDIYGRPCPSIADYDGDGDLDLVTGEFRDGFTYFQNVGTRTAPRLAAGRPLETKNGLLKADLCMISPFAVDWNKDGKPDLIVGQEDGRVSIMLNAGLEKGQPIFEEEFFLKERGGPMKSGALSTPWLDSETGDLYAGNTAGYIEYFKRTRRGFENGRYVTLNGAPFRVIAGYNGSIQGPAEEKWGYTVPYIGDVDGDGRRDILFNSIIGRLEYLTLKSPYEAAAQKKVVVHWKDEPPYPAWNWWKPGKNDLAVQWRTRPMVIDVDDDGLKDIVAMDHEGYLAFFRQKGNGFDPGKRLFINADAHESDDPFLRLNDRIAGKSGRAKIDLADWDGDGDLDLIRNTTTAAWFENLDGWQFAMHGDLPGRKLAGHTSSPHAIDWDKDGKMDLILGAEDGRFYCFSRAYLEEPDKVDAILVE
jgi:hypothetical protein